MTTRVCPEGGRSRPFITRVCIGEVEPYGTRVEDTSWGTLLGLATGTETGWEIAARSLGDPALSLMSAALHGPDPTRQLPDAFAAVSRWFATESMVVRYEDGLPVLSAILALCELERITLAWIGSEKAYLIRDGRIIAESEEHTHRVRLRPGPLARPLTPKELSPPAHPSADVWASWATERSRQWHSRMMLGRTTLEISREVSGPPAVMQLERQPGDMLVLLSGDIHSWLGWDLGLTAALAANPEPLTVERLVAQFSEGEPSYPGEQRSSSPPYGPIILAQL